MDPDMTKYAALLQAAKAEQDSGDLKSAYATYLKAHAIIMRILGAQIIFRDQDSLESAPDNYTQLFAHVQEILRRIKDIVDQSKTLATKSPARSASSTSIASRMQKTSASPSVSSSANARPGLTSSHPSQRSIATISQLNKRTKKNVPMIPISPLTRQALLHSYALSQVTQKLEQAKQGSNSSPSGSRDLASLRRLIEDVRIQRAKLDTVNAQIQSVSASVITSWDADMIARQITVIDTQLFKDVAIPKDLVRSDRKTSAAQRCIDFETYVAHSTAHLLLLEWNTSRQHSPINSPTSSKSHAHVPINAVAHMIKVANILLNVYRNFNGFMAVMRALTSPEIKRMHKLWSSITSKTKDSFKKLVQIYQARDGARCYREAITQKLDAFQDVGKDALVAIPWMRYHVDEVKSIINSYLTGHKSTDGSGDIVLSAPGARKLSAVSALLVQCRTNENGAFDRHDVDTNPSPSSANAKHREAIQIDGSKMPLTPILDLTSLGTGDISLHHWILSRPFLNKQQLIDESLEIEPLSNGEELPCYNVPFENDDSEDSVSGTEDLGHGDSFEHVITPKHASEPLPGSPVSRPQSRPSLARAPVSETEINDIMSELLNDDASDGKGLFDDIGATDEDEDTVKPDRNQSASQSPGRSRDVLQFLGIDPEDYSDNENSDGEGEDITHKSTLSGKGKGKAVEGNDTEEINNLLAQVKGLVHESRSHTGEIDSRQASYGFGLDEEMDIDKEEQTVSSGLKFEPFQQGNEEDHFDLDISNDLKVPELTISGIPEVSSMLSLDALRRQLQSMGQESDIESKPTEEEDSRAFADNEELVQTNAPTDSAQSGHLEETPEHPTPNEPGQDMSQESVGKSDQSSPNLSTSPSVSVNPFAPFIIKKPSTDSLLSTSPNISKGRRRKIQTDRTGRTEFTSNSSEVVRTVMGFSPPRFLDSLPTDGSDSTMDAIAARAKMSLASHGEKKLSSSSLLSSSLDTTEAIKSENGVDTDTILSEDDITTGKNESLASTLVSFQELDKKSLDSLPHSSGVSGSSSQSASMTVTSQTTTRTITTSSHAEVHSLEGGSFQLGASLMESSSIEPTGAIASAVDNHTEAEESANTNEGGSGAMDKSPIGDLTDGQAIRSNRQRRRKAGGVINVPASSRSLLSKASTSSLSSAWNDERAHGHDLEQEHLGHGSEQSRPGDDGLEVESRSSASASSTNIGGLEAIKDSDQDPQDKDSGDGIA